MSTLTTPPLFGEPQTAPTSDDRYTPPWVFHALALRFDLDVSAPPGGVPWIPAARYLTVADDALAREWSGCVWMNPPFSNPTPWVRRFIEHAHGVALLGFTRAEWTRELWKAADGIVLPDMWVEYLSPTAECAQHAGVLAPWFAAFGPECVDAIGHLGRVRA